MSHEKPTSGNREENPKTNGDTTDNTAIDLTVNHSGRLEGPMQEKPHKEFSGTIMDALAEGHLTTPDTPFAGFDKGGEPDDAERAEWQAYKTRMHENYAPKKSHKGLIIGSSVVAGVLLVGGGVIAGVNLTNNEATPTTPTNEAPTNPGVANPTEAPTAIATPSPTDIPASSFEATPTPVDSETSQPTANETEQGSKYTYLELKEMSTAEFIELPLTDRLVYAHGMLDYFDNHESGHFGDGFDYKPDTSDIYEFNPNNIAGPDNTVEDVIKQILMSEGGVRMQTPDLSTGSSTFDIDMATKFAASFYVTPEYIENTSKDAVEDKSAVDSEKYFTNYIGELQHQGTKPVKYPQAIDSIHEDSNIKKVTDDNGDIRYVAELKYTLSEGLQKVYPNWPEGTVKYVEQKAVLSEDGSMWLLAESSYTSR